MRADGERAAMRAPVVRALCLGMMLLVAATGWSQQGGTVTSDTAGKKNVSPAMADVPVPVTLWGFDLLLSNSGFGFGLSYRREYTEDLAGQVTLSVSESKEDSGPSQTSPGEFRGSRGDARCVRKTTAEVRRN